MLRTKTNDSISQAAVAENNRTARSKSTDGATSFNPLWFGMATHTGSHDSGIVPLIQTKLTIGAPDDVYEREADAVAERVMRMPAMPSPSLDEEEETPILQIKPLVGNRIQRAVRETPQVYKQPGAQVAMVHLHGDERNALEAARRMYGEYCANLVHLNNARRCVTVDIPGSATPCTADPNRIFSSNTVTEANAFNAPCSCPPTKRSVAAAELTAFRDTYLLPAIRNISTTPTTTLPIVAFHNNTTPGGLSIRSYRTGGGESAAAETDPARLGGITNPSIAPREDPDNFLLVTRPGDYTAFAGRRNVVLQSASPTDDGSLSVALRTQRYINIEAQQKRFVRYADAHFLTNKAMADEVFAHLGVNRHPCVLGTHEQADEGAIRAGQSEAPQGIASFFASIVRGIIRLLSEIVRVVGQLTTMPAPLPREATPASLPRGCRTFFDQAAMDTRKGHWASVVSGMSASDVVEWIIGTRTPPAAATREARQQMDCLLHAMRASARRRGAAAPPRTGIVSGRRSFSRQRGIWERKFNFERRVGRFDRVSAHARRTCGSLLHASDDKWDTGLARHRVCWNAPPLRRTTPPPIPSGARPLTDSERQAEILQASSAPGISRHHWGTDFDLFGVNPKDWEAGQPFADEYSWLMRNASQYGFIQSFTATSAFMGLGYMEERWHWSYYPIAQALLEYARSHQTQIETALIGRWGSGTQFSYIQRHWREYMFNVGERGVF